MQESRLHELIEKFIEEGEKAARVEAASLMDDACHLSPEKRLAWAQLLSSVASAEGTEELLMRPILEAAQFSPKLQRYFAIHADDENRHQKFLKEYVANTFQYVRRKKTFTDKVIYGGLFKSVESLTRKRPLASIVVVYFYEWFAEGFYTDMMNAAERDGLLALKNLFAQIEKDEKRHRAGLKTVLSLWKNEGRTADMLDLVCTKSLLEIIRFDLNAGPWAFHNQRVRRNLLALEINPDSMAERAKIHADKALDEIRTMRRAL